MIFPTTESASSDEYIDRAEAARIADVSVVTIGRWLKDPHGPRYFTFRRRVRIPRAGFLAWLNSQVEERGK
jgi:hypothetical protein